MSNETNKPQNLKLIGASATKPPLGIVPMHSTVGESRVLEDAATKYAPGNFMCQSIEDAIEAYDSAELRHRLAEQPLDGIVTAESYAALDPDSGIPHIFHRLSGLRIIAQLMIRDGIIPMDPGMGKRKRKLLEEQRAIEASKHMGTVQPGDAPCTNDAVHAITLDHKCVDCAPVRKRVTGCLSNECAIRNQCTGSAACPSVRLDAKLERSKQADDGQGELNLRPDEADELRRRAAEVDIKVRAQLAADEAEAKRKWDQRCLTCNGSGNHRCARDSGPPPVGGNVCNNCKGTGQRTGAEGMRV